MIFLYAAAALSITLALEDTCYNKFEYEYNVLQKLVFLETKISTLTEQLDAAYQIIRSIQNADADGYTTKLGSSSYIHWGRSECPQNATLVYTGYAAGSHYTHSGAAANYLCLPKDPNWDLYVDGFQSTRIYGAEYETDVYSRWKYLHQNDVPCALCRTPHADVVMVPGKNVCHKEYTLEYKGYLMAGWYGHNAASEYVCVDGNPDSLPGGSEDKNGKLFYFVEAECGSLKCPPYVNGRELTCAICSYSPPK